MKKMFFFDIDGTLIECNKGIYSIPDSTRNAMDKLKKQNDDVFLATGRCKCFIVDGVMDYPFSGYVTCNGAYVEYNNQVIYKKIISVEAIRETHKLCQERNMTYYFEGNDHIYILDKKNKKHLHFKKMWGMKDQVIIDTYNPEDIETYIGMIIVNSEDDVPVLMERLSPYFQIQRHQSGFSFDLTLKGESKAKGIRKIVEALNLEMEQTVAFGDGRNDVEMLSEVGLGIAMGNASKEAKSVANYVTSDIDDDGIVKALEYFSFFE